MADGSRSLLGDGSTTTHTRFDARQCGATQPNGKAAGRLAGRGSAEKDLMDGIAGQLASCRLRLRLPTYTVRVIVCMYSVLTLDLCTHYSYAVFPTCTLMSQAHSS